MSFDRYPFFVYGTLRPQESNYHLLQGRTQTEQPAQVSGYEMYNMGTYPMLLPATDTTETVAIQGALIYPKPGFYQQVLRALDRLEGYNPQIPDKSWYTRHTIEVTLNNGNSIVAWVYLGNRSYLKTYHHRIKHGDWVRYRRAHQIGEFRR